MQFTFKAIDASGHVQTGVLDAASDVDALNILAARSLQPTALQRHEAAAVRQSFGSQRIRPADNIALIRELATLLSSGVTLLDGLVTLAQANPVGGMRTALERVLTAVQSGTRFSESLREGGFELPEYVFALSRAGEATGDLGAALTSAADQLEFDARMRAEANEALTYPLILMATGVAAIIFVFAFVVPRFSGMLKGRNVELAWLSKAVLSTGAYVNAHWQTVAGGIAVAVVLLVLLLRSPDVRKQLLAVFSQFPILGTWIQGGETARWTAMLAVLVKNRVPILLALELTSSSVRLDKNVSRLRSVSDEIRMGKALSTGVEELHLLEPSALTMLKVGEKTGDTASMLAHIAQGAAAAHRSMQRRVVSLIEPVSIVVIGGAIGVIMVGVVLAMASLTEVKL